VFEQDDQNAALIAERLEAAGDMHGAYDWHMRAGRWSTNRDNAAAQLCWERARHVADALPLDSPNQLAMRIAPRTLLCSNAFRRFHPDLSTRFDELRELCMEAGDKASLAIGMAGLVMEHVLRGRIFDASRQASEQMALVESVGDTTLTLGVAGAACIAKLQAAEMADALRWTQVAIELADGDAASANFMLRSPLATALVFRGYTRCIMGRDGWREDMDTALAIARTADPVSLAMVTNYKYATIAKGVLLADDAALADITEAAQIAERSSEDLPLLVLRMTLGTALTYRDSASRERGLAVLAQLRDTCIKERYALNMVPALELYITRATGDEDVDRAIQQARTALNELFGSGNFANCDVGTRVLVELLLARGAENDLSEAEAAIERLVGTSAGSEWVTRDLFVLRLRALLARARGEDMVYREHRNRYRAMANELGYQGHMAWAAAMP
jgi:adenylate cyclase